MALQSYEVGGRHRRKDGWAEGITAWLGMVELWVGLVLGLFGNGDISWFKGEVGFILFCDVLIDVVVKDCSSAFTVSASGTLPFSCKVTY